MSRLVPGSCPVQVVRSCGCVHQPLEDKAHLWKGPEGQHASLRPGCTWHLPKGQGVPPAGGIRKPQIWKVSVRWLATQGPFCPCLPATPRAVLGAPGLRDILEDLLGKAAHPHHPAASTSGDSHVVALLWGQKSRGGAACSCCFPLWEGHTAQACFLGS